MAGEEAVAAPAAAVPVADDADPAEPAPAAGETPEPVTAPEPSAEGTESDEGRGPAARPRGAHRKGSAKRTKAPWWELPVLVVVAIAIAVLTKTFLIQPFYIPSQSMEPTLHGCPGCSGDRILVNKPIYHLRAPHPGDIIVFRAPTDEWFNEPTPAAPSNPILRGLRWAGQAIGVIPPNEHDLVKRVIAVGGQTVRGLADGTIEVSENGAAGPWHPLDEPYVHNPLRGSAAVFGPVTIPKGRLWVMGDNRANSEDSRYHYTQNPDYAGDAVASTVPVSDVIGKAALIAWPPSRWTTLGTPATFKHEFAAAAAALPMAAPTVAGVGVVAPIGLMRRRRRRRAWAERG
ncbi:MAG: signal peptidase I [Actinomycetia bacterium]|nr:signal peptidase I [Actinomycetes bacterium]